MYKLVSCHMSLVTEGFVINITITEVLVTMCKLVFLHIILPTECFFYTHHRHTDAGHYV